MVSWPWLILATTGGFVAGYLLYHFWTRAQVLRLIERLEWALTPIQIAPEPRP